MTVIVGYLPKPEGEAALERGIAEARLRGTRLLVLNSTQGEAYIDNNFISAEAVSALEARLTALEIDHEVVQRSRGKDAGDELLGLIEERRPDLLVIGVRRRSPVGKLFLGSTAQRLILGAECPVLAVKV